jgi:hypothetical protein
MSGSPSVAWDAVAAAVDTSGFRVPYELRVWDIPAEVEQLAKQLAVVRELAPLPADLTFLYFGLFDWADVEDPSDYDKSTVGFYVSGGNGNDPAATLHDARLSYFPEDRFLESPLLQEIRIASRTLGPDYNVFDYGLMLGAAGVLAKFAAHELTLPYPIMVGFDSGDFGRFA